MKHTRNQDLRALHKKYAHANMESIRVVAKMYHVQSRNTALQAGSSGYPGSTGATYRNRKRNRKFAPERILHELTS